MQQQNEKQGNGWDLIKSAMDYLPLLDLSTESLLKDYVNVNYGDFLTRFLLRMALEDGKNLAGIAELSSVSVLGGFGRKLKKVIKGIANELHEKILDPKNDVLGVLHPSCHFLHLVSEMDLVKMHMVALYPFRAHAVRMNESLFQECEDLVLLPCYESATLDHLFRFAKISLHAHDGYGGQVGKAYVSLWEEYQNVYNASELEISAEYADFADEIGNIIRESDQSLFNKQDPIWLYRALNFFHDDPNMLYEFITKKRKQFDLMPRSGHFMSALDLFLHSNTGMLETVYGDRVVKLLDYHISLCIPYQELKKAHEETN